MSSSSTTAALANVEKIITVLSGKGGVGKSSVAVQLALTLVLAGKRVGLLDVDLCGPSIPRMLNITEGRVTQGERGWHPVALRDAEGHEIRVMSIAFLLPHKDDAVVWRGPKKTSMLRQFLFNVDWGHLDYLIIDTPPGTSDEHISLAEVLVPFHPVAIIVTTPQLVALADVEREIGFCRQVEIPIAGIIENMSGYLCPVCSECTNVFSSEGGRLLAEKHGLTFLGKLPIYPPLARIMEDNDAVLLRDYPAVAEEVYRIFQDMCRRLALIEQ